MKLTISDQYVINIFASHILPCQRCAIRYGRKSQSITLNIVYPYWDTPFLHSFKNEKDLTDFLKQPPQFLIDPDTGRTICHRNINWVDLSVIYDIIGSGIPYHQKGLSQEQVWEKVLNAKPLESEQKSNCKTEQRETEGTWLQLLRSCTLHLLCCSRFQRYRD